MGLPTEPLAWQPSALIAREIERNIPSPASLLLFLFSQLLSLPSLTSNVSEFGHGLWTAIDKLNHQF